MRGAHLAVMLLLAGCGTSPSAVHASPSSVANSTLQSVAAQPGDLPSGYVTCSWSGDFGSYAKAVKTTDSTWAQQLLDFWQQMKTDGATAGWVQDLSITEDACLGYYSGSAGLVSHITCIVVMFKDSDAATNAYSTNKNAFGLFSGGKLEGAPTKNGISTGLGPNSVVVAPNNLPFTLAAAWQKNAYYLLFIANGNTRIDDNRALAKIDARVP